MNITNEIVDINILRRIMEIDDLFYTDSITPFSWYERYYGNNIVLLKNEENQIVGYLIIAGIEQKLYNAFYEKLFVGDVCINSKMFDSQSEFKYLSSVVILEQYRRKGFGSKMLKYALSIQDTGTKIVTMCVSKSGYNLMEKQMNLVCELDSKTALFSFIK